MDVKVVDHGKCFGNDHWYLFYCPHCSISVSRSSEETEDVCKCGKKFKWSKIKEMN